MTIRVRRYEPGDLAGVASLNERFAARGIKDVVVYPEASTQPAEARGDPLTQELYVAVEDGAVRGGVWLHEHEFALRGQSVRAGWLKYPVSESLIDRAYGGVPGAMFVSLMRRQPNLMALGMGSRESPIARLLARLGWAITAVPFYVAPLRAGRVLRELQGLHRGGPLARLKAVLAHSGLASATCVPLHALRRIRTVVSTRRATAVQVTGFGEWADRTWETCRPRYGFIARRDARMLSHIYPRDFDGLTRLRVMRAGRDIGWICATMADLGQGQLHHAFGHLKVGMLADALSEPSDAATILALGTQHLAAAGVDVIVTNQSHAAWRAALPWLGFLRAPSNFFFACSKSMNALLTRAEAERDMFLNRGDCDGPRWW